MCVFAQKKTDAEKTEAGGWKKKKRAVRLVYMNRVNTSILKNKGTLQLSGSGSYKACKK
jgi:hypothetical protein